MRVGQAMSAVTTPRWSRCFNIGVAVDQLRSSSSFDELNAGLVIVRFIGAGENAGERFPQIPSAVSSTGSRHSQYRMRSTLCRNIRMRYQRLGRSYCAAAPVNGCGSSATSRRFARYPATPARLARVISAEKRMASSRFFMSRR
jgi:hypothetical protein